jgi:hypothetical protein
MLVAMVMSGEVDVVDYNEDDEIVQRPARAQTKAPSPAADTRGSFPDVDSIEDEEMHVIDDFDLSSEDEASGAPTKRKAAEISQDDVITDHADKIKHIKIEDEDEDEVEGRGKIPPPNHSNSPAARDSRSDEKGQFHWALEDDDDDDDESNNESQPNRTTSTSETRNPSTKGAILPSPPQASDVNSAGAAGIYDIDPNEREDGFEDYDEEEDEELEMNVGKVYEKTLVQLGQSLGESLVDD